MLCDLVLLEAFSAQITSYLARVERETTGLKDVSHLFAGPKSNSPLSSRYCYTLFFFLSLDFHRTQF